MQLTLYFYFVHFLSCPLPTLFFGIQAVQVRRCVAGGKKALIYHMWHYDDGEENNCNNQAMVKLPGLKRTDRESSGGRVNEDREHP